MYEYQASVLRIIDGDTLHLDIDLGLGVHAYETCRLSGVNCPELRTVPGLRAKEFTTTWLWDHGPVFVVHTTKDRKEKYGRYLVDVHDPEMAASLNRDLVGAGHATTYSGGPRA